MSAGNHKSCKTAADLTAPTKSRRRRRRRTDDIGGGEEEEEEEESMGDNTFSYYRPTGLPNKLIGILNNGNNDADADDNDNNLKAIDLKEGIASHTSIACESALLSSVPAPKVSNDVAECFTDLANIKALSPLQLEGICLAISRHNRLHKTITAEGGGCYYSRAGFFIGDGAGIGKGRQIAGILRDSLCRNRPRHLWISVSRELILDAQRDCNDVQLYGVPIHDGSHLLNQSNGSTKQKGLGLSSTLKKGILFVTYSLLISTKRIDDIVSWLSGNTNNKTKQKTNATNPGNDRSVAEASFDGCIVFDEAHKAKNLDTDTRTAKLVIELQRRLPKARIVYCSATGVSDVKHMVYAERLGLWGTTTTTTPAAPLSSSLSPSFSSSLLMPSLLCTFSNFEQFQSTLTSRGLGSLELLALEMKQMGSFVARTLSWDGAHFETNEIPLSQHQRTVYDNSVAWWKQVKVEMETIQKQLGSKYAVAGGGNGGGGNNNKSRLVWRTYWSAHQRFFKELAICFKIPWLVEDSKRVLQEGCSVVIGLQGTGESGTQSFLEEQHYKNNNTTTNNSENSKNKNNESIDFGSICLPDLISTAASVMMNFVRTHFPVAPLPPEPMEIPTPPPNGVFSCLDEQRQYLLRKEEAERIRALPPPQPIPAFVQKRQHFIDRIQELDLPPNPLDDIIDQFGGIDHVAEMTGRLGRIVRVGGRITSDSSCNNNNTKDKQSYFQYQKRQCTNSSGSSTGSKAMTYVEKRDGNDEENIITDRVNIVEKSNFMSGNKRIAIISDAASTGISLHSAKGSVACHRRRVHYTIELPWAADKAIQQLGRTHRSGQVTAPVYKLLVTELGGERRFAAAVAKRMSNLGALTKGDRRAATGGGSSGSNSGSKDDSFLLSSNFDLDSTYGKRALKRFYTAFDKEEGDPVAPSRTSGKILDNYYFLYHHNNNGDKNEITTTKIMTTMTQSAQSALTMQQPSLLQIPKQQPGQLFLPPSLQPPGLLTQPPTASVLQYPPPPTTTTPMFPVYPPQPPIQIPRQQQPGQLLQPPLLQPLGPPGILPPQQPPVSTLHFPPAPPAPTAIVNIMFPFYPPQQSPAAAAIVDASTSRRLFVLHIVNTSLNDVGLGASNDTRKNAEVKVFLNRISGLEVNRQQLVFSLFMSTLEDVIEEAKSKGEYEGSVEDLKATTIEVEKEEVIAIDPSCGATTKLTKLILDRGISFRSACNMALMEGTTENEEVPETKKDGERGKLQEGGKAELVSFSSLARARTRTETESNWDGDDFLARNVRGDVAKSGFYLSRYKVAGRYLILFAKRKSKGGTQKTKHAMDFDPLGLMVITRPNTGTNPYEMSTSELQTKYKLIVSANKLKRAVDSDAATGSQREKEEKKRKKKKKAKMGKEKQQTKKKVDTKERGDTTTMLHNSSCNRKNSIEEDTSTINKGKENNHDQIATANDDGDDDDDSSVETNLVSSFEIIQKKLPNLARQWTLAYEESNYFHHNAGLPPRLQKVGLVSGAVLHIMPALEKAVEMRSGKERALKVIRVDVPATTGSKSQHRKQRRRLVGVQYPADKDAVKELKVILCDLKTKRKVAGDAFYDEALKPVSQKSMEWATTKPKTMKSFFSVVTSTSNKNKKLVMGATASPVGNNKMEGENKNRSVFNNNNNNNMMKGLIDNNKFVGDNKIEENRNGFFFHSNNNNGMEGVMDTNESIGDNKIKENNKNGSFFRSNDNNNVMKGLKDNNKVNVGIKRHASALISLNSKNKISSSRKKIKTITSFFKKKG